MNAPWINIAIKELGVAETPGPRATARIIEYFRAADSPVISDETAWCSAFACWVMEKAGLPSTNNLMARSWLRYGKPTSAKPGAIGILPRGADPRFGHVVFVVEVLGNSVRCIGGNQGAVGKVSYQNYPIGRFIGFRWPNTFRNSGTIKASAAGGFSTFMAAVAETTQEAIPVAQDAASYVDWFKYICLALALASFGVVIYRRLGKMKAPEPIEEGDDGA